MNTQVSKGDKSLLQILVEELKEWPLMSGPLVSGEEAEVIVQDGDAYIIPYIVGDMDFIEEEDEWYWGSNTSSNYFIKIACTTLASDYQTAKITKQMWEEEKKKMEMKQITKSDFTKDDLKIGMVMTTRNGVEMVVISEKEAIKPSNKCVWYLDGYTINILNTFNPLNDIMKVTYGDKVVFIREEKTEQQKAIEEAEKELAKLQENARMIEQSIKKLKETM